NGNYIKETWAWDGAKWTELEGKDPHYRGLASMFYDPISKKVVLYGGIGRESRDGTLLRFGDTWTLNGKDWVEATSANSPPARYGAAVAYNPADNKVHLFGGVNDKIEFVAEHFVWDGAKWSKVEGGRVPPARQNARLAWDPTLQQFVLFGGFGGYYFSDLWILEGSSWRPEQEEAGRRRTVTQQLGGTTGTWLNRAVTRR
ncbi:MAG TPA: kelch repeat-containing protein, partial [Thermoanaerobaculia bacterium]